MKKSSAALTMGLGVCLVLTMAACRGDDDDSSNGAFDASFDSGTFDGGGGDDGSTDGSATTISFVSGPDWPSFDGDLNGKNATSTGNAKTVCLTATAPASCPSGSVIYGATPGGWAGAISSPPGAEWIWRGDVTVTALADLQFAVFEKTFTLGKNPGGSISMLADDFVSVRVNGMLVGSTGSVTDENAAYAAQSMVQAFDLGQYLVTGTNTITVIAQNGPQTFASCAQPCTFMQNTAATMFAGTLTSE